MKTILFTFLLLLFSVDISAAGKTDKASEKDNEEIEFAYKNDEEHIAEKVDENNVPIDPACKIKLTWKNVKLSSVQRGVLKTITIVKFSPAGAWIAWRDEKGYHETIGDRYIQWRSFPKDIKTYYENIYKPNWKVYKSKTAFGLRTPPKKDSKMNGKKGTVIKSRSGKGLLCREISGNIFIPYSEFPLDVRTACGYYENEAYIPSVPILERKNPTLEDEILFIRPNDVSGLRKIKGGSWILKVKIEKDGRIVRDNILIEPFKGRFAPNHKSDLHIFRSSRELRECIKCKLSDHVNKIFFNFMFDRQSRTPCQKTHSEYALRKKGEKQIGKFKFQIYEYDVNYDKNNPSDSKAAWDAAQVAGSDDGGADGGAEIPEGMPTE